MESSQQTNETLGKPLDKLDQKTGLETLQPPNGKLKSVKDSAKPSEAVTVEVKTAVAEDRRKGVSAKEHSEFRLGKKERPGKPFQPARGLEAASRDTAGRKSSTADKPVVRQSQVCLPTALVLRPSACDPTLAVPSHSLPL